MDDDRYLTGGGEIIPEQRSASYSTNTSIGPFSGGAILAGQEDATPIVGGRFTTQLPEGLSATLSRTGQAGAPMEYARDAIRLAKQLEAGQLALEASRVGSQGLPSYGLQYSGQIGKQGGAPSYYPQPKGHWFVEAGGTPSTPERHVRGGARFNFADGGTVEDALHAVRHHLAGGGFLSDLFSGPDYLSTGEAASPTNWGDPELASDFFKADKALRLAREVQGKADDVTGSIPARAPLTAPRPGKVEERELPAPPVNIPFAAPERGVSMLSSDISPESVTSLPLAYAPTPVAAPAAAAIDQATGKLTARIPEEPSGTALTKQQADYITRTIAAETSGKTPEETQAIASVILNRINSGQYGSSPEAVLFAKRQFEPWMNPAGANYPMKISPTSRRYLDAQAALEAALAGEDITGGATHFWGPKAQEALGRNPPSWSYKAPGVDIGETRFHKLERAEGGEVEGYAGGGDVVAKALAALRSGNKVFPKPQRMFPADARPPGGEYINAATGEAMTGQKPARAVIGVTPEGKPVFLADPEQVDVTGSPGKGSAKTKTNLFKQQAGWKWSEAPEGYENVPTIVSAENRGQHYYGLGADFPKGVDLERYANAASEPRLRPTTQGNVYPGEQVGSISVRGKEHPVYDMLTIRNMLAGTGAGAAGAAAMPEDAAADVNDALRVVREHHADGEAVGPTAQQRLRETIASIDPERSREQPVMDPATMGEAWDRARRNYQNFPVQEGEAVARPLELGARDVIGGAIAGGAREPGAQFRRGVADLLVGSTGLPDSGTLGFGVADAPMITGIPLTLADMAHDIGQGDYTSTAMGAALPAAFYARGPLGAAGRRAVEIAREYAKPAAAAATGVAGATVAPDEAEAAKLSKALNIIRTAERPAESRFVSQAGEHGFFQPQSARERDPRLWHPISNTVLSRPLGEMTAEHQLAAGIPERKFIRPEDLEGASLIPALGDRTMGGGLLRGVNDISFKNPVEMQAGHSFMYGPAATGPDRAIWASDPGVITILSNKAKAASEAGFDPYLSYVAMGSRSGDYSHHMTDALREMFAKAKVKKDVVDEFDRQMRENTANKWAAYADWPGLKSKNLEEYLYSTGPGKARTKMAELMGQGQFQKAGMPEVGAARFAITDPELLHAADYSAGRTIARLDPMGRKITEPAVPHKTYKHQLAAHPEEGYVGGFEYDIPFEVMNKEFIDSVIAKDAAKAANPSQLAYTYRMNMPRVDFTPQVVDRLSKFLEMKKMGLIP